MEFKAAKCTECGGSLQVPDDRDQVKCMYCGASIVVQKAIQLAGVSPANYMNLAEAALAAANPTEALGYFNKVLEIEPRNSAAWLGKGSAAGWASTLVVFRLSEMLIAFENAIKFADANDLDGVRKKCALQLNEVAMALYGMARKHMIEYIALPKTWAEYLPICRQIISACEVAHTYDPENRTYIENVIHLCSDNIQGVRYNDPYDNNASKSVFLSAEYEQQIRNLLTSYAEKLKKIDPTYVAPNPQKKDPGCFVVTATMGDENHPSVLLLRSYRDQVLNRSVFGRTLIAFYYLVGPRVARTIGSPRRKRIVQILIVDPLVRLARLSLNSIAALPPRKQ